VASLDCTTGAQNETLHACAQCVPDHVSQHFPESYAPIND